MHLGLEPLVPMALYLGAMTAFLLSLFWRPQVGLYFLIPLLPLQTIRYRIMDFPLGNKLIDILLLGVILGAAFRGQFKLGQTPMMKLVFFFGVFCYAQLWRGAFYLDSDLPWTAADPRFSNWKNYMVLFLLFAAAVSVIREVKQIQLVVVLIGLSVFAVDKSYYSEVSDRDLSHFSYEVRDGGPLGYAGVNGAASFEAELMLFLMGINAFLKQKRFKCAIWVVLLLSGYCLLFSFSREAYAGVLLGLFCLGVLKQRWVLVALAIFILSWESFVPVSVRERVMMTYDPNQQQLDESAQDRVAIWDDAMDLFQQNPVLGGGFDTYEWQHRVGEYRDTHNYFLKVLVETGVVGLLFFLWIFARATGLGLKLYRTATDPFLKSLGLGFLLLMVCAVVVNFFGDRWQYVEVTGFLWVLLACVVRAQMIVDRSQEQPVQPAPVLRHKPSAEELPVCA